MTDRTVNNRMALIQIILAHILNVLVPLHNYLAQILDILAHIPHSTMLIE